MGSKARRLPPEKTHRGPLKQTRPAAARNEPETARFFRGADGLELDDRAYRHLVENAGDIIYVADRLGRLTYVNPVQGAGGDRKIVP